MQALDHESWTTYEDALAGRLAPFSPFRAGDFLDARLEAKLREGGIDQRAIDSPLIFDDRIPPGTLGEPFPFEHSSSGYALVMHGVDRMDPEQFAHTLLEEIHHIDRALRHGGWDLSGEYHTHPHEVAAREFSEALLGFKRPRRLTVAERDHPTFRDHRAGTIVYPDELEGDLEPPFRSGGISPDSGRTDGLIEAVER